MAQPGPPPGAGYGQQSMQQNRGQSGPPAQNMYQSGMAPPTSQVTNQMSGMNISGMPPQRMQGPGMRPQQGPPNSMAGAPYSRAPPTSMGMTAPGMSGPGPMSGPPSGMSGQPPSTPPSSMPGPPTSMGYQQNMGYSPPPGGPQMGNTGIPQQQMGPPAYPGGPPVPQTVGAPPGPGARQPCGAGGPPSGPGGMGPGPGMQQAQQPAPRRLDPDQMPSVIQVIEDDRRNRGKSQFATNLRGQVPPLVSTEFDVIDQGNCSPRFMRSTVYNIPCTQDMIKQSHIPIAVVISPFGELKPTEAQPPIVDHGPNGPVRCNRCKAYMCPYMQFLDGGRRFQCAFCGGLTEVPPEYFQPLDHMGRRVDSYDRPELSLGAYEFLATTDYCKNSKLPEAPAFVFMIDVTYQSVKTGMVHLLCKEMSTLLDMLPREHGMKESSIRVGFVTYDSTLHFYNLNSALAQPQMLVVSDVSDVFMPLLDGFMVKLSESRAVIESLLEQIPQMFAETRETETMLGPVVQAGLEALKAADCVGKLYVFHASLPIAEAPGKLKNRDDRKLLGTDKEKTLLAPQINFYTKLGQDCVGAGCSVDLFLFPNAYVDLATIGQVSTLTGGQVYKYNYFQAANDGERFIRDLTHNIKRAVGFDAVMRVRASTGLRPTDFFGTFYMANTTDVELASVDSDKAVTVEIKHDDKLAEDAGAFVQVALLYTSISGQRRLRILNLSFNCCTQMADMYRNCETDCMVNYLAKHSMKAVFNSNPKAIRDHLISRCATILGCYRRNCAAPSSQGQLILPECMKLLPLYTNCILKSDALCGSTDITTDDRSWLMDTVMSMGVASSHAYFYPRLLPLLDLPENIDSCDLPVLIIHLRQTQKIKSTYYIHNNRGPSMVP
ncbi:protein transport protein Sec24C-like isoform X1 [Amphiura filiformis]|uniref:protein transport protein Sec24C-like isoform X1 n=1 Tax=Amphiura filiformis TaxID=82378 RepID=UPI003B219AE0